MTAAVNRRLYGWRKNLDSPRVVLLTAGEGHRAFCIGGDVTTVLNDSNYDNLNYAHLDYENASEYIMHA